MTETNRRRARRQGGIQTTDGNKLLSSILRDGATAALRQIDDRWFSEDELAAYEFIDSHYRRYSRLPSLEALQENAIVLPEVQDPVDYYLGRCENRAMYQVMQSHFTEYNDALRNVDMPTAVGVMRTMLSQATNLQSVRDVTDVLLESELFMQAFQEDKFRAGLKGVTTGYAPVDEHTNGLQAGDVGILVGRPNMGKTFLLLHMVTSAWLSGKSILFVSMEMTTQQIVKRLVAIMARINPAFIQRGKLSYHTERHMGDVVRGFGNLPPLHFVAGRFRKTMDDIENYVMETTPDVIYIDGGYLVGDVRGNNRMAKHEKLTNVMEDMKRVATDRARPLLSTVQFNREMRKGMKGGMDLGQIAGTDAIGQIATLVMGIQQGPRGGRQTQRVVELLKNREGELLKFLTNFRFSPLNFDYLGMHEDDDTRSAAEAERHRDDLRESMI